MTGIRDLFLIVWLAPCPFGCSSEVDIDDQRIFTKETKVT